MPVVAISVQSLLISRTTNLKECMQYCTVTEVSLGWEEWFLLSQEWRGLSILWKALPLYRQKWHEVRKTLISSLWKQSSSAFPSLLILLFITTRLRMWQLSCRGLSPVDYEACHTYTLIASFLKRKTTKSRSLQNSRRKNVVKLEPKFGNDTVFNSSVLYHWSQSYLI